MLRYLATYALILQALFPASLYASSGPNSNLPSGYAPPGAGNGPYYNSYPGPLNNPNVNPNQPQNPLLYPQGGQAPGSNVNSFGAGGYTGYVAAASAMNGAAALVNVAESIRLQTASLAANSTQSLTPAPDKDFPNCKVLPADSGTYDSQTCDDSPMAAQMGGPQMMVQDEAIRQRSEKAVAIYNQQTLQGTQDKQFGVDCITNEGNKLIAEMTDQKNATKKALNALLGELTNFQNNVKKILNDVKKSQDALFGGQGVDALQILKQEDPALFSSGACATNGINLEGMMGKYQGGLVGMEKLINDNGGLLATQYRQTPQDNFTQKIDQNIAQMQKQFNDNGGVIDPKEPSGLTPFFEKLRNDAVGSLSTDYATLQTKVNKELDSINLSGAIEFPQTLKDLSAGSFLDTLKKPENLVNMNLYKCLEGAPELKAQNYTVSYILDHLSLNGKPGMVQPIVDFQNAVKTALNYQADGSFAVGTNGDKDPKEVINRIMTEIEPKYSGIGFYYNGAQTPLSTILTNNLSFCNAELDKTAGRPNKLSIRQTIADAYNKVTDITNKAQNWQKNVKDAATNQLNNCNATTTITSGQSASTKIAVSCSTTNGPNVFDMDSNPNFCLPNANKCAQNFDACTKAVNSDRDKKVAAMKANVTKANNTIGTMKKLMDARLKILAGQMDVYKNAMRAHFPNITVNTPDVPTGIALPAPTTIGVQPFTIDLLGDVNGADFLNNFQTLSASIIASIDEQIPSVAQAALKAKTDILAKNAAAQAKKLTDLSAKCVRAENSIKQAAMQAQQQIAQQNDQKMADAKNLCNMALSNPVTEACKSDVGKMTEAVGKSFGQTTPNGMMIGMDPYLSTVMAKKIEGCSNYAIHDSVTDPNASLNANSEFPPGSPMDLLLPCFGPGDESSVSQAVLAQISKKLGSHAKNLEAAGIKGSQDLIENLQNAQPMDAATLEKNRPNFKIGNADYNTLMNDNCGTGRKVALAKESLSLLKFMQGKGNGICQYFKDNGKGACKIGTQYTSSSGNKEDRLGGYFQPMSISQQYSQCAMMIYMTAIGFSVPGKDANGNPIKVADPSPDVKALLSLLASMAQVPEDRVATCAAEKRNVFPNLGSPVCLEAMMYQPRGMGFGAANGPMPAGVPTGNSSYSR